MMKERNLISGLYVAMLGVSVFLMLLLVSSATREASEIEYKTTYQKVQEYPVELQPMFNQYISDGKLENWEVKKIDEEYGRAAKKRNLFDWLFGK